MGFVSRGLVVATGLMPKFVVAFFARRYVAGKTVPEVVEVVKKLQSEGCCATIDVLGEAITSLDEVPFFLEEYTKVLEAIESNSLDANISIKPTAFGLHLDKSEAMEYIAQLATRAKQKGIYLRLDMEDHTVTDDTLEVTLEMQKRGFENVGVVLQSRLKRNPDDLTMVCDELGSLADFRLCKGIYLEPADIAFTGKIDIIDAMNRDVQDALERGAYVAIASQDDKVVNPSLNMLKEMGMGPGVQDPRETASKARDGKGEGYEFQMLLGVRRDLRQKLTAEGHRVRIYVPYGERWYQYSMRRLQENPTLVWHTIKAIFMPWTNRP